jgi:hypothetical protein
MKRLAIIGAAVMLFASTAAIASADDADSDTDVTEASELSDAQQRKAELLADYIVGDEPEDGETDAAIDEIVELRTGDPAVGWGAMFKLLQLAKATGTELSLTEYMAEIRSEGGWAFGRRFKELDDEQRGNLDDTAKNLGQLKQQAKEPKSNNGHRP